MASESTENDNNKNLPRHIAVIMDGNNRWAKLPENSGKSGHRAGAVAARTITDLCIKYGVQHLTLFVFSSENWLRPEKEVKGLMALFLDVLKRNEVEKLHKQNIRLAFIGDRKRFSRKLTRLMADAEALTAGNTGLKLVIAADYGGRWDIVNASRQIAAEVAGNKIQVDDIDEALFSRYISTTGLPDPDLCIRTGGEQRISNFLLWQFAYTELYFTDIYWPEFDEQAFTSALEDYTSRQRRFGKVSEQVESR